APRQSEFKKLLRATINAAIITSPRHRLAILIVVRFPPRLSRYSRITTTGRIGAQPIYCTLTADWRHDFRHSRLPRLFDQIDSPARPTDLFGLEGS
ncbi:hypothetical protein, partial [Bradyrhizobium sp. BRP19]|uniref:hypothetical protein n=1 Tax=Bradyrhizobium sp. BRP19 TaxID=2793823 RepID=UPI001CD5C4FD